MTEDPRESAPAVKLLTAITRTPSLRMRRFSTHHRGRSRIPHTSLPWHRTEIPDTTRFRASRDATGSNARCATTRRVGVSHARNWLRASASNLE